MRSRRGVVAERVHHWHVSGCTKFWKTLTCGPVLLRLFSGSRSGTSVQGDLLSRSEESRRRDKPCTINTFSCDHTGSRRIPSHRNPSPSPQRLRLLSPLFETHLPVVISGTKLIRCSLCCLIQHFMLALEQQSGPIGSKAKLSSSPKSARRPEDPHDGLPVLCLVAVDSWTIWWAHCGDTPAVLPSVKERAELRFWLVAFATTQSGRDRSQGRVSGFDGTRALFKAMSHLSLFGTSSLAV